MNSRIFHFVLSLVVLTIVFTMTITGCGKRDKIVAKVGEFEITQSEFRDKFIARHRAQQIAEKQSFRERMDFLNSLIDQKLMLADAYRKGLDKREEIEKVGKEHQERVAVQTLLYNKEIVDKVITPQMIRDYYDRSGEEIHARHILIRIENSEDSTSVMAAKSEADSIYQLLVDGADFEELAKECSDDKSNAEKGGDLGYFKWGRMVDEFQKAAFALKIGEISQPVKTMYGYHIIELLDRRKVEQKPFEEEKDNIAQTLRRLKSVELRELANEYIDKLKTEKGLVYYDDSLEYVYNKVMEPGNPQNVSLFSNFSEAERKMVVASWQGGDVTVAELDEKIGGRGAGAFNAAEDFKQVIDGIVVPEMLAERAKERGVYNHPDAVKAGKEAMEQAMIDEVRKIEIDDKMNFDDATLKKYYEEHKEKYASDPQVAVREILVEDEKLAKELLERGKKGESFKKLAKKYTTRASAKDKDGLLGPFGKNRYGRIGREAHKLEEGEFCRRPIRMGRKYSVFQVEQKIPAEQQPFEKVKKRVEQDYRTDAAKDYQEKWLKSLREEIPVKIYEDNLREALPFMEVAKSPSAADKEKKKPQPAKTQSIKMGKAKSLGKKNDTSGKND